jgi:hypothetical protein
MLPSLHRLAAIEPPPQAKPQIKKCKPPARAASVHVSRPPSQKCWC